MSLITFPSTLKPQDFQIDLSVVQRAYGSPFGGQAEQVTDLLNDRWTCSFQLPGNTVDEGAAREAFVAALRGQANWVALWHMGRPMPRGTLRGSPVTASAVARGAAVLPIQTTPGWTLLPGDFIGADGLLFICTDVCTADGTGLLQVPLGNRVRRALPSGMAVVWNRPTALFRLVSASGVRYVPGQVVGESAFDFIEKL